MSAWIGQVLGHAFFAAVCLALVAVLCESWRVAKDKDREREAGRARQRSLTATVMTRRRS